MANDLLGLTFLPRTRYTLFVLLEKEMQTTIAQIAQFQEGYGPVKPVFQPSENPAEPQYYYTDDNDADTARPASPEQSTISIRISLGMPPYISSLACTTTTFEM